MYKHLHSTGTEKTFPLGSISKLETPIINTTMMQYHAVDRIVILLKNPNPVIYTSSRSQKSSEKSQYARTHQPPPLRSACVRTHLFCVYKKKRVNTCKHQELFEQSGLELGHQIEEEFFLSIRVAIFHLLFLVVCNQYKSSACWINWYWPYLDM